MMLQRRKAPKMGLREPQREFPAHTAWIRGHCCTVPGCEARKIEAHHVRKGVPADEAGGTGIKPHDKWLVPLCRDHHQEAHDLGADTFDAKHGITLLDVAKEGQRTSPHAWRWREQE